MKKNETGKTIVLVFLFIALLGVIGGLIYCMITGTLANAIDKGSDTPPAVTTVLTDGTAVSFTGAGSAKEIYINLDKTVYADLASELGETENSGYMLVFTDKKITEDMTEEETSKSILMIVRFVKSDIGYELLFESLIDGFGTKQDVIVYNTDSKEFCKDTSIVISENGRLSMPASLKDGGLPDVMYCYTPVICGCNESDTVSAVFMSRIFATVAF